MTTTTTAAELTAVLDAEPGFEAVLKADDAVRLQKCVIGFRPAMTSDRTIAAQLVNLDRAEAVKAAALDEHVFNTGRGREFLVWHKRVQELRKIA